MSNNETLSKIVFLVVLMNTVLSESSLPKSNYLYDRFSNRLEEVANFAESEFKKSTSEALKKIYAMNAKILQEQIDERKNAAEILKFQNALDNPNVEQKNSSGNKRQQKNFPSATDFDDTTKQAVNISVRFRPQTKGEYKISDSVEIENEKHSKNKI